MSGNAAAAAGAVNVYAVVLLEQFIPILSVVLVLTAVTALAGRIGTRRGFGATFGFIAPFGFLGGTSGLIAGASSEPIVGALLTGLLGLISALLSFLVSKETLKEWRVYLPAAITLLCLSALGGLTIGKAYQTKFFYADREYARWLLQHENVDLKTMAVRQRYDLCVEKLGDAGRDKCAEVLVAH